VERNLIKINIKSSTIFEKIKKCKFKKLEKKQEKNCFCEIHAKKVCFKMDQQ